MKSVLFPIVKKGSGVAFSANELDKWETRFPIPGVHDDETAADMWDSLIDEITADIKAKYKAGGRTQPGGEAPAGTGESKWDKRARQLGLIP
jgi:hypothetical protein